MFHKLLQDAQRNILEYSMLIYTVLQHGRIWKALECSVELGLCNLSLEFSLTHVVVAESSFGWPWWSIVDLVVLWGWLVTLIWGGRYIKFIVWLNSTRLDSSVVRASGICPEGLGSIPSLVTFLYSNILWLSWYIIYVKPCKKKVWDNLFA